MIVQRIVTVVAAALAFVTVTAGAASAQMTPPIGEVITDTIPITDYEQICVQEDGNLDRRLCVPWSEIEALRFVSQSADYIIEGNTSCIVAWEPIFSLSCAAP